MWEKKKLLVTSNFSFPHNVFKSCLVLMHQNEYLWSKKLISTIFFRGNYRVLYITPEYATSGTDILKKLNENVGIDLIAIDEAHCVSQWGHDFRASFRNLGQLKSMFPMVCIKYF